MIVRLLNHNAQNKIKRRDDNEEDHLRSCVLSLIICHLGWTLVNENRMKEKKIKKKNENQDSRLTKRTRCI